MYYFTITVLILPVCPFVVFFSFLFFPAAMSVRKIKTADGVGVCALLYELSLLHTLNLANADFQCQCWVVQGLPPRT